MSIHTNKKCCICKNDTQIRSEFCKYHHALIKDYYFYDEKDMVILTEKAQKKLSPIEMLALLQHKHYT